MTDAAPVRLTVIAARLGLTPDALRKEARRGRLAISRVGGKDWTTEAAVMEMFEKCRVEPKAPAFTSVPRASVSASAIPASGSSSTGEASVALASALATVSRLRERYSPTSRKNTSRRAANVLSPKFGSPT